MWFAVLEKVVTWHFSWLSRFSHPPSFLPRSDQNCSCQQTAAAGTSLSCPRGWWWFISLLHAVSSERVCNSMCPGHTREGLAASFQLSRGGAGVRGSWQWGGMRRGPVSFVLLWAEYAIKQVGAFGFLTLPQLIALTFSAFLLALCS